MSGQSKEEVGVGTWVKVTGFVPGEEEVFHVVPDREVDVLENKIPPHSPLARVLAGTKVGDKVVFRPPGGEVELTVVEVGQD